MSKYLVLGISILSAAVFATVTAGEEPAPKRQPPAAAPLVPDPAAAAKPACVFKASTYRWHVRKAFPYSSAGGNYVAFKKLKHHLFRATELRRCAKGSGHEIVYYHMLNMWHKRKQRWNQYAYIDRITPYGKWAIPWPIVRCESGGSWGARNASGAEGPYQLLGHGQPWPVRTLADKIRHHEIALSLWRSSGSSPWSPSSGCSGY